MARCGRIVHALGERRVRSNVTIATLRPWLAALALIVVGGTAATPPRGVEFSTARLVVFVACVIGFVYVAYVLWDAATTAEAFSRSERDGDSGPSLRARKDVPLGALAAVMCSGCALLTLGGAAAWWQIVSSGLCWIAVSIFLNTASNAFVVWRVGEGAVKDAPLPWPSEPPRFALWAYLGTSALAIALIWFAEVEPILGDAALIVLIISGFVCVAFEGLWPLERFAARAASVSRRIAPWMMGLAFAIAVFRIEGTTQLGIALLALLFSSAAFILLVPTDPPQTAFDLRFRIAVVASGVLGIAAIGLFVGAVWMPQLADASYIVGTAAAVGVFRIGAPWQTAYGARDTWSEARMDAYIAADARVRRYRTPLFVIGWGAYMLWVVRHSLGSNGAATIALAVVAVPLFAYAMVSPLYLMKAVRDEREPVPAYGRVAETDG